MPRQTIESAYRKGWIDGVTEALLILSKSQTITKAMANLSDEVHCFHAAAADKEEKQKPPKELKRKEEK